MALNTWKKCENEAGFPYYIRYVYLFKFLRVIIIEILKSKCRLRFYLILPRFVISTWMIFKIFLQVLFFIVLLIYVLGTNRAWNNGIIQPLRILFRRWIRHVTFDMQSTEWLTKLCPFRRVFKVINYEFCSISNDFSINRSYPSASLRLQNCKDKLPFYLV